MLKLKYIVFIFFLCLSSCNIGKPVDKNAVQIATEAVYPPFEKLEGNGEISGFDMDLIRAVAKASGLKINIHNTGWDPLFEGINNGTYDVGVSAITILDERKSKCDFSDPYFESKQLILVPSSAKIRTLKELQGQTIGVQTGTTGEAAVQRAFGKTYQHLKGYDDTMSAIEDLTFGRLDSVIADQGVVMHYIKNRGKSQFKVVEDPSFPVEHYGFCLGKGKQKLLDKLNAGLKQVQQDGTYKIIYERYFSH